jgi:hypothetical protein
VWHDLTDEQSRAIADMIEALETPTKPLAAWETVFLESVADQFERHGSLTEAQIKKLSAIYEERT